MTLDQSTLTIQLQITHVTSLNQGLWKPVFP